MLRLPHWSSLAAIALAVSSLAMAIGFGTAPREPMPDFGVVPEFTLVERSGRTVSRADLDGQLWVADFIFTSCAGTCPLMTYRMKALQEALPPEVRLVSITVDPARDTPEALARYADAHGADDERWLFLTGEREAIYTLARDGFHLAVDDTMGTEVEPITHSSRFALIDGAGRIRGYYDGTAADAIERIVEDAQALAAEAG